MNEREELEKIADGYEFREVSEQAGCGNCFPPLMKERILNWHSRHRVKVSRDAVQYLFLKKWKLQDQPLAYTIEAFIDDLLSLLNSENSKYWCVHIKRHRVMNEKVWVYTDWEVPPGIVFGLNMDKCPTCGKERPKE